jgi:hypothetical protein
MAVTLQRSIYINSFVTIGAEVAPADAAITTPLGAFFANTNNTTTFQLAQSCNYSLNIPRADVNAFGFDGVLDRPQLEAETATMEVSFVAQAQASGLKTVDVTANHLNDLIEETKAQIPAYVKVLGVGVGGVKAALMNSLSGEVSVGSLATMTASFTGATNDVTNPQEVLAAGVKDPAGNITFLPPDDPALGFNSPGSGGANLTGAPFGSLFGSAGGIIVTPQDIDLRAAQNTPVSLDLAVNLLDEDLETDPGAQIEGTDGLDDDTTESCAQSASFSWDMPVEIILCLGSDPTKDGLALGNPPGSASITVEALSAQLSMDIAPLNYNLRIGAYGMWLTGGRIDSRTHNLAIGDLYGTYNYVIGGTGDGFEMATL